MNFDFTKLGFDPTPAEDTVTTHQTQTISEKITDDVDTSTFYELEGEVPEKIFSQFEKEWHKKYKNIGEKLCYLGFKKEENNRYGEKTITYSKNEHKITFTYGDYGYEIVEISINNNDVSEILGFEKSDVSQLGIAHEALTMLPNFACIEYFLEQIQED